MFLDELCLLYVAHMVVFLQTKPLGLLWSAEYSVLRGSREQIILKQCSLRKIIDVFLCIQRKQCEGMIRKHWSPLDMGSSLGPFFYKLLSLSFLFFFFFNVLISLLTCRKALIVISICIGGSSLFLIFLLSESFFKFYHALQFSEASQIWFHIIP